MCAYKSLTPTRYGEVQPFRSTFDRTRVAEMAQSLLSASSFYWDCERRVASGTISPQHGRGRKSASLSVLTSVERLDPPEILIDFLQKAASRLGAIIGYVHRLCKVDSQRAAVSDGSPRLGLYRWQLVRCIPDLYWANVFGPEYVALFGGAERVRSAPAPVVRELAPDTFYIQLSGSMLDFETRYAEISAVREQVKQHLGADCFFDYEAKFAKKYRVPDLGWEEPARAPMTVEEIIESLKEGKMHVLDTTGGEYRKALE